MTPMPAANIHHSRHRQRGVGLIEVLVSLVIVSIGLLGAAALQATALRNNLGSFELTQTSILTQGIFDAMRANRAGVTANGYNTDGWICVAPSNTSLASSDVGRWIDNLHQQVQSDACGNIDCVALACTVQIRWDDSRATGGNSAQTVQSRAQL